MPVGKQCQCGAVTKVTPCKKCRAFKEKWRSRSEAKEDRFHQSNEWKKLSKDKRAMSPLCERCDHMGLTEAASEVHHIKPISTHENLKLEWTNLISLCSSCHHAVHRNEPLFPAGENRVRKTRGTRRSDRS